MPCSHWETSSQKHFELSVKLEKRNISTGPFYHLHWFWTGCRKNDHILLHPFFFKTSASIFLLLDQAMLSLPFLPLCSGALAAQSKPMIWLAQLVKLWSYWQVYFCEFIRDWSQVWTESSFGLDLDWGPTFGDAWPIGSPVRVWIKNWFFLSRFGSQWSDSWSPGKLQVLLESLTLLLGDWCSSS